MADLRGSTTTAPNVHTNRLRHLVGDLCAPSNRPAASAAATATASAQPSSALSLDGPLSPAELRQWETEGYVVLRTETPAELLAAARDEIWRLAQREERDPATWYRRLPVGASRSGTRMPFERSNDVVESWRGQADLEVHMLGLWHTQAQWSIRQQPRIHAAFAQLWQTEKLCALTSRTSIYTRALQNWALPEPDIDFCLHLTQRLALCGFPRAQVGVRRLRQPQAAVQGRASRLGWSYVLTLGLESCSGALGDTGSVVLERYGDRRRRVSMHTRVREATGPSHHRRYTSLTCAWSALLASVAAVQVCGAFQIGRSLSFGGHLLAGELR